MMKNTTSIALVVAVAIAVTVFAVSSSSSTSRTDCPGKIVCPLTGDLVCKDHCPLGKEKNEERPVLSSCCQTSS